MKLFAALSQKANRQTSVWALLCLLLISQAMAVAHAADLGAHDAEPCEICLITASSDGDDFIESSGTKDFIYLSAATHPSVSFAAYNHALLTSHLIRAPPQ